MNSMCIGSLQLVLTLNEFACLFLTSVPGIELPGIGFLLICSCRACEEPAGCECQGSSEFVDESGRPMHAYTQTVSTDIFLYLWAVSLFATIGFIYLQRPQKLGSR